MTEKHQGKQAVGVKEVTKKEEKRDSNNVRKIREALLMCKAELARKAGLSPLTIDRIESGHSCRVDTKRKIILALGLGLADKDKVWPD
jgi:DNA-binding XRE family transcriptional regulator